MATVGIQVIIQALRSIFWTPVTTPPDMISAWAALFSAAAMLLVYRFNANLAKRTRSSSLQAASKDNLSDALVSLGAAAGIFGSQVGAPWLDPLAAVVVGGIICKTAWEIFSDSAYQLTDGFNKADINRYRDTIKNVKGVKLIKDIKARKHGNLIFVDTVIQVHPEMDVIESHRITDRIEKLMRERHHVAHTHIHVEPITHVRLKHGE